MWKFCAIYKFIMMAILSFNSPSRCGCIDEKKFYSSQEKVFKHKNVNCNLEQNC